MQELSIQTSRNERVNGPRKHFYMVVCMGYTHKKFLRYIQLKAKLTKQFSKGQIEEGN